MGSRALAAELRAVVEGHPLFGTHDRKVVDRVLGDLEELLHTAEHDPEKLDCGTGAVTVDEALYLPRLEGEERETVLQVALALKEEMRELGALQARVATGIAKTVKPGLEKLVAAVKAHRELLRR
jgi:hypothetical protein